MAEYTGAQETVPLGRNATKAHTAKLRTNAQMLIDDAEAEAMDEDDEEAMEWEAAQIRRAGDQYQDRSQSTAKAVYRAAPSALLAF
jgi:GC-rich sequence DNA-binding factor